MIVVSYSKSFEFTTKSILVRSFFEEWKKRKKRKVEIVERQIGQVQTRSNLFELVRNPSRGEREEVMVNDGMTRLERHRFFTAKRVNRNEMNLCTIAVDGE